MAKKLSPLGQFDKMQADRYLLAKGKDGDGDPAYAGDVFKIQRKGRNDVTTIIETPAGMSYKNNNGD